MDVLVFPEFDMSRGKKGNSKSAVECEAGNEMFENEAVNDVRLVHAHCFQKLISMKSLTLYNYTSVCTNSWESNVTSLCENHVYSVHTKIK